MALGFAFVKRMRSERARTESLHTLEREHAVLQERNAGHAQERERLQSELAVQTEKIANLQETLTGFKISLSERETMLTQEREAHHEKIALINALQEQTSHIFKSLSLDALSQNSRAFLELAEATFAKLQEAARGDLDRRQQAIGHLVDPVRQTLSQFEQRIGEIEKARIGAYEGLYQQVKGLAEAQQQWRIEASGLIKALGTPKTGGQWGEMQLRRVVEIAGMMAHCDFEVQPVVHTEEGRLRPDMVIRLPQGRQVIVDAKAPLAGYLDAMADAPPEQKEERLRAYAHRIRHHAASLGKKEYWSQFQPSPEFVVMFLPGESFFRIAIESDPELIAQTVAERVILATPTILIALLKVIAHNWQQEALAQNAREIYAIGQELHKRLCDMGGHFGNVGKGLRQAVESYNKTLSVLESRVLVSARRFQQIQGYTPEEDMTAGTPVEIIPRPSPES